MPRGGHGDSERAQGATQAEVALATGHRRCEIIGIFRVFFSMRLCFVPFGVAQICLVCVVVSIAIGGVRKVAGLDIGELRTHGQICLVCVVVSIAMAGYARLLGRTPVSFEPTGRSIWFVWW